MGTCWWVFVAGEETSKGLRTWRTTGAAESSETERCGLRGGEVVNRGQKGPCGGRAVAQSGILQPREHTRTKGLSWAPGTCFYKNFFCNFFLSFSFSLFIFYILAKVPTMISPILKFVGSIFKDNHKIFFMHASIYVVMYNSKKQK